MKLIYTSRTEGFESDGLYRNPSYFQGPEKGVSSVLVEGEWPEIVDAYEALDIPVEELWEEAPQPYTDQDDRGDGLMRPGSQAAPIQAPPTAKPQRGRRPSTAGAGTAEE
ncbi:hypothetical protein [Chromobacterium haemolyticum]|uniref:hypothetical protein n=1 Tax=Chromobacterium haemolyticum TaxID=394935 RepID=UPI0013181FE1|nr:hypothetical protein [Chromobacterium haemolyticum]BBH12905.1 hypothetical protein CH06BL_21530 [Chromobacterium haemolyticum]